METEILARIQFAFTIGFQYVYPPLSLGLIAALLAMVALEVFLYFLYATNNAKNSITIENAASSAKTLKHFNHCSNRHTTNRTYTPLSSVYSKKK